MKIKFDKWTDYNLAKRYYSFWKGKMASEVSEQIKTMILCHIEPKSLVYGMGYDRCFMPVFNRTYWLITMALKNSIKEKYED